MYLAELRLASDASASFSQLPSTAPDNAPLSKSDSSPRVAIKVIDKLLVRHARLENKIRQEMVLHTQLQHPHVLCVHVRECVCARASASDRVTPWHRPTHSVALCTQEVFEDARNYYMVLEYCEQRSVAALVKSLPDRRLDESTAKRLFYEVRASRRLTPTSSCIS